MLYLGRSQWGNLGQRALVLFRLHSARGLHSHSMLFGRLGRLGIRFNFGFCDRHPVARLLRRFRQTGHTVQQTFGQIFLWVLWDRR